jgi:hypothetical protein
MTDSSKIPNIHGPKGSQESSNEQLIDPEKFKKINKVDESEEAHKRNKRNLKKEEEDEEEEKVSGETPEGSAFSELMDGKPKLKSIYDIDKPKNPPVTKKSSLTSSTPAPQSHTPHLGNQLGASHQNEDDRFYISTGPSTPPPTQKAPEPEKPREKIPEYPSHRDSYYDDSPQRVTQDTAPKEAVSSDEKNEKLDDSQENEKPHPTKQVKKKPLTKPEEPHGLKAPHPLQPIHKKDELIEPLIELKQEKGEEPSAPIENEIPNIPVQKNSHEHKAPHFETPHSNKEQPTNFLIPDEKNPLTESFETPLKKGHLDQTHLPPLPQSKDHSKPLEEPIEMASAPPKLPENDLKPPKETHKSIPKKMDPTLAISSDEKETLAPSSISITKEKSHESDEPDETPPLSPVAFNPLLAQPLADAESFLPDKEKDRLTEKVTAVENNLIQPFMTLMPTSTPVEMPVYTRLSKEVFELFEKMVGLLTIEKGNGISTTTVTINLPNSPFNKSVLILEHYDTAPNAFNIELQGSANAVNLFNENLSDLISAFQYSKLTYEVNVRRAVLLPEERGVNKRKEDITKDLK